MQIKLKQLRLTNFKRIRDLTIPFDGQVTDIFGDNAEGKTTLFDGFLWLLFGKDSTGRKDFQIKTLGTDNQPYHGLDHEVEGILEIDGTETTLRRLYKEKWVKTRGKTIPEFTGHETAFFWNDVPKNEKEYQAKISDIIDESIFRLLTDTGFFNSLKWQDRRARLLDIAGSIPNSDILSRITDRKNKAQVDELAKELNAGKSIDEYKRQLSTQKKKIKENLESIPARIQEANRAMPEEKDYAAIEELIAQITADIQGVDGLLMNKTKQLLGHQDENNKLISRRSDINRKIMDIEFELKNAVHDRKKDREAKIASEKSELRRLNDELTASRREYQDKAGRKTQLLDNQTTLRSRWAEVDTRKLEFKEAQFCCPTCKREYEAADVEAKKEELTKNFNTEKSNELKAITERGQAMGKEITDLDIEISNLTAKGEKLNTDIATIQSRITNLEEEHSRLSADDDAELEKSINFHEQYQQCRKEIIELNDKINLPFVPEDNSALKQRKKELQAQLDDLKAQMADKGQREKQLARVKDLQEQEEKMNQELAGLEGYEACIEAFDKAKMDTLEERINDRFQIVRFKMFEEQINGGSAPACTTLIDGVPYADANAAARVQAGLDIINVLSDHYDVQAPVWVDNRESTVRLPETKCQLINLRVVEGAELSFREIKWKKGFKPEMATA